jgi:DNA-binding transcriptional LysR family regulator
MRRVRRLQQLWSWLPAFRAVAESQHLPTAGASLGVSPSALSRSVKLLEEQLGRPVFDRVGNKLLLNHAGRELLAAVRDGMRIMDEGLEAVAETHEIGPVTVSVPGPFAADLVLPVLSELREAHPRLTPVVRSHPTDDLAALLTRGALDLALTDDVVADSAITSEPLGELRHSIFCGPGHPLQGERRVSIERLCEQDFVAPVANARGVIPDAWPAHRPRPVALSVTHMSVAIEACARGELLAVLPDLVGRQRALHRLPWRELGVTTLYLLRRPALPRRGRIDVVADALEDHVRRVLHR